MPYLKSICSKIIISHQFETRKIFFLSWGTSAVMSNEANDYASICEDENLLGLQPESRSQPICGTFRHIKISGNIKMKPSPTIWAKKQIWKISTSTVKSYLSKSSGVCIQVLQEEGSPVILVVRRLEIVGRTIHTQGFEVIWGGVAV